MIDERRRREEQRLRRAQQVADSARERAAELVLEMRERAMDARNAPVELAAYRRTRSAAPGWSLPDDVC
ncbi:MAG TPA: hypothetical protein VGC96_03590 [Candidatus Elarobacter sp.]|jgi:hypothetical protein